MLKDIGLQFNGGISNDGNEWQHHVDCLEGSPQELRQVSFDNGGRLLASFPFRSALADFARARPFHTPSSSAPGPQYAQDRPTVTKHMCHQSIMCVSS